MKRCCYNNDDDQECGCFPLTGEFECNTDDLYRVVQVRQEGLPAHYRLFPAGRRPQTTDREDLRVYFGIFRHVHWSAGPLKQLQQWLGEAYIYVKRALWYVGSGIFCVGFPLLTAPREMEAKGGARLYECRSSHYMDGVYALAISR